MVLAFLKKSIIPFLVGALAGVFGMQYLEKPVVIPDQPDCICPEPQVQIQPIEVEKIKGLKTFTYSPQFTGSIQVAGVDSTSVRRIIEGSINRALKNKQK